MAQRAADLGPARAHAYVALRPAPGRPRPGRLTVHNVRDFHAREDMIGEVARALEKEGFTVTGQSRLGVGVAGTHELAGRMFATFLLSGPDRPAAPVVPPHLEDLVDHVRVAPRIRYFGRAAAGTALSRRRAPARPTAGQGRWPTGRQARSFADRRAPLPDAPALPYYHLDVPEDVARLMDARAAHDHGFTGAGVRLCVIDTGFHPHEWYAAHGFEVTLVGHNHPEDDVVGHGTGIITNAMAVAPGAHFFGVKLDDDAAAAFQRARTVNPHVISCSWGTYGFDRDLHDEIVDAVAHGIIVCFAAGNGPGGAAWPGSMPEVVSVGGVYVDERGRLEASSYASSGLNSDEPGRRCPDVCGLTGQMPMGIYIAMPTQEGSDLDGEFSSRGDRFPEGDATGATDGWLVASGTSSATPAVAGVAALVLQAEPGLSPDEVKTRLEEACRDVTVGASANGDKAAEGPDPATGSGLVDAFVAVHPVDLWCKDCPDDNGTVPDTYPAAWTSPDIWIRHEDDHGLDAGFAPVAGRANWVYVRVRNRGRKEASGVKVHLYWAEPSLAIPWPSGWRASGIKVDGAAGNVRTIETIPAGGDAVTAAFEWWPPGPEVKPEASATGRAGSGAGRAGEFSRPCLLARVECPDDPVTREGDVPGDNNLAARNILVAEAAPGGEATFVVGVGTVRGLKGGAVLVVDRSGAPREATVSLAPAGDAPKPATVSGGLAMSDSAAATPGAATGAPDWAATVGTADLARRKGSPPAAVRRIGSIGRKVLVEPLNLVRGARQRIAVRVKVPAKVPAKAEPATRYTVRLDQRIGEVTTGHVTLVLRLRR